MPKIILVGGFLKSQTHALNNLAYMDRQSSLFDENGQEITVREAQQAVRDTESIIWRHYVSFRREDVERLSVDREYMKALVTLKKAALAKTYHIAPENLRAFCSWHNKDHHPHMHMIFFSTKRREGYLIPTKGKTAKEAMNAATERMKAAYAREVFREELTPVYEQKTQVRDQLSENVEEQLRTITKERYKVDPALTKDLRALGKEIRALEGRKYYMYLPPELKEKVDGMLRRLVDNDPNAGKLFEEYRTTQQEIVKTYAENPISVAKKMKEWENDFFHPAQGGDSKRHNMIISSAISFDREQEYREKCQAAITRSLIYNLCRSINQDNERGKKVLAHTSKTTKKYSRNGSPRAKQRAWSRSGQNEEMDIMNDGLNNTEQMYSPCIVCYRVNGVTILRSEETGELRGIEEPLETVCPYSVEEYALTKSLDAVLCPSRFRGQ